MKTTVKVMIKRYSIHTLPFSSGRAVEDEDGALCMFDDANRLMADADWLVGLIGYEGQFRGKDGFLDREKLRSWMPSPLHSDTLKKIREGEREYYRYLSAIYGGSDA